MTIDKKMEGTKLVVALEGRLDTTTAPELEEALKAELENAASVDFDFTNLSYISSAGLRVLLGTQKVMMKKEGMVVKNASAEIKEIFDVTGFSDILTIE